MPPSLTSLSTQKNQNTGCSLPCLLDALRARLPAAGYSHPLTAADVRDLSAALVAGPLAAGDAKLVRRRGGEEAAAAVSPSVLSTALERVLRGEAEEERRDDDEEECAALPPPPPPPPPEGGTGRDSGRGGRGRAEAAGRGRRGPASDAPPSAASPRASASARLFLVPSLQAWRSAVGLSDDVLSPHALSGVQLEALERVARSRSRGALRSELGRGMGIELKNFHYVCNHLSERGAVSATPALLAPRTPGRPPSSTTRLHLPRFAPEMRPGQALWEDGEGDGDGNRGAAAAAAAASEEGDEPSAAPTSSHFGGKTVRDDHAAVESICSRLAAIGPGAATPDNDLKRMLGLPATQPGNRTWRRLRAAAVSAGYADAVSVRVGGAGRARPALVAGKRKWDGGRALLLASSIGVGAPGSRSVAGAAGFSAAGDDGSYGGMECEDEEEDSEEGEGERERERDAAERAAYETAAGLIVPPHLLSPSPFSSAAPSSDASALAPVVASVERGLDSQIACLLSTSGEEGVPLLAVARAFASGTARGRARLAASRARHGVLEISRQRGKSVLRVWLAAPELRAEVPPPRPAGGSFMAALALAASGGGGEGRRQQGQQRQQLLPPLPPTTPPSAAAAAAPPAAAAAGAPSCDILGRNNTVHRRRPPPPPLSAKEERSLERLLSTTAVFLDSVDASPSSMFSPPPPQMRARHTSLRLLLPAWGHNKRSASH